MTGRNPNQSVRGPHASLTSPFGLWSRLCLFVLTHPGNGAMNRSERPHKKKADPVSAMNRQDQ